MRERTEEQIAAERYLLEMKNKVIDIQSVQMEIDALEYAASGMGAIRYDKEHVDGTSGEDRLILFVSDALEKRAELEALKHEAEEMKINCYQLIKQLTNSAERVFLEWYYINAVPMLEAQNKLFVSQRKLYYIKDDALQHFGELLKRN